MPEPDGPKRVQIDPLLIEQSIPLRTSTVLEPLVYDFFRLEISITIKDLEGLLVGRGAVLSGNEVPDYERFIPKKEYIKKDNRFSPPGVEWLYLALGNEVDIHECSQTVQYSALTLTQYFHIQCLNSQEKYSTEPLPEKEHTLVSYQQYHLMAQISALKVTWYVYKLPIP